MQTNSSNLTSTYINIHKHTSTACTLTCFVSTNMHFACNESKTPRVCAATRCNNPLITNSCATTFTRPHLHGQSIKYEPVFPPLKPLPATCFNFLQDGTLSAQSGHDRDEQQTQRDTNRYKYKYRYEEIAAGDTQRKT